MNINEKLNFIRDEIIDETRNTIKKKLEDEKKKWEEEYQRFQTEMSKKEAVILELAREETKIKKERLVSRANLDNSKKIREKRKSFIDDLILELRKLLISYRKDPLYSDFLKRIILKAIQLLGSDSLYINFNKADAIIYQIIEDDLNKEFPEKEIIIKNSDLKIDGGVIIESQDGKELVENTFRCFLDGIKEEIAIDINHRI